MADGRLTGRVYGKAGFKDGTLITTSAVPKSQRTHTHVVTETGTAYLLGMHTVEETPVIGVAAQIKQGRAAGDMHRALAPPSIAPCAIDRWWAETRAQGPVRGSSPSAGACQMCSICQETCETGQAWDVTPCKHAFHEECLRRWLTFCTKEAAENDKETTPLPTCPDCRHPLSSSRFRLFG